MPTNTMSVPYTNSLGQVINPGDPVAIVTKCTGMVYVARGTYLGLKNNRVQCSRKVKISYWVFKGTEDRVPPSFYTERSAAIDAYVQRYKNENPNKPYHYYQDSQYKAILEEYSSKIEIKFEHKDRVTTLCLNRIYKLAE